MAKRRYCRINYSAINMAALASPTILKRLLPDGRLRGTEYFSLNPKRHDRSLGSFKINVSTGKWGDFATDDTGGDLISLVAYLKGLRQSDAARLLARMLGSNNDGS